MSGIVRIFHTYPDDQKHIDTLGQYDDAEQAEAAIRADMLRLMREECGVTTATLENMESDESPFRADFDGENPVLRHWDGDDYKIVAEYVITQQTRGVLPVVTPDGITIDVLPDSAVCGASEGVSPLELDECPLGYEECCPEDCFFYDE